MFAVSSGGVKVVCCEDGKKKTKTLCDAGGLRPTQCLAMDGLFCPHVVYATPHAGGHKVMHAYRGADGKWVTHEVYTSAEPIPRQSLNLRVADNVPRITFSDGKALYYAQPPQ